MAGSRTQGRAAQAPRNIGRTGGFTLLQLVIAVAILTALSVAGVVTYGEVKSSAAASKILDMADTFRKAAEKYYMDTGWCAIEYSGTAFTDPAYHRLTSAVGNHPRYKGPYLSGPITEGHNPFKSFCHIYNNFEFGGGSAHPNGGFDLDGDGTNDATGDGSYAAINGVPLDVAQKVDKVLDADVPGDWRTTGRVEYAQTWGNYPRCLLIFLHDSLRR